MARTFAKHVEELKRTPEGTEVLRALVKTIRKFEEAYDWQTSFPQSYSHHGPYYNYRFHASYIFSCKQEIIRGGSTKPTKIIFKLRTVNKG